MITVYCGKRNIRDLEKNDEFYIGDLNAKVINKKNGGVGTVLIVKLDIHELIKRNMPFSPLIAVKVNQRKAVQDEQINIQFKQELVKWSLLRASGLMPLSAILEDDEGNWIAAMPAYLGTAYDFIRNRKKEGIAHLYEMIIPICFALHELHKNNSVHLDIKPGNILYKINELDTFLAIKSGLQNQNISANQKYEFVLSDFATAHLAFKHMQKRRDLFWLDGHYINEFQFGGTIPYMAPERFSHENQGTQHSDLFSLGITCIELLTGHLPYNKGNIESIAKQIINGEYFANAVALLRHSNINKHLTNSVLNLIKYDQDARASAINFGFEYNEAIKSIGRVSFFFSSYDLKYAKYKEYLPSHVALDHNEAEENYQYVPTESEIDASVALLFRDLYKRKHHGHLNKDRVEEIRNQLKLSQDDFKAMMDIGAFFEVEKTSHLINAFKKTGYTYEAILKILKPIVLEIEKDLLPAKQEDTNSFTFIASHVAIPQMVLRRPYDISSLWTSVFPINSYIYLSVLSSFSVVPEAGYLRKTSHYHDWLNQEIYYYMIQFSDISDNPRQELSSLRKKRFMELAGYLDGKAVLGCHYSVILYNNTTKQYHCIAIGNSAFGVDVRTSHEWVRATKNCYRNTIPTTDCETPLPEVYGEAKLSGKECLNSENILKFLKDNVTKIFES